jgi:adenylate cyclase
MKECRSKSYQLTKKLTPLLVLDCKIDTVLSAAIYYLNEFMESERTSIFIFQAWKQELTVFSSLDLEKHEISIPKSSGVSGWVFENRAPAIINNAYQDNRFFKGVDEMTGFYTRNIICTPMIDRNNCCLGTLQSLNKKEGSFDSDDLELLDLAAHLVAISISNSKCYNEITSTNAFQKKVIDRFMDAINDAKTTYPML